MLTRSNLIFLWRFFKALTTVYRVLNKTSPYPLSLPGLLVQSNAALLDLAEGF
ncbi:hypothetical protein PanWU01x14_326170 [Parasponia andersonii]|uniref:Uncharacterized protein n=1 Tax=Parasponia andersonii TaxID=3476 RepID=A0A2P5AJJ6_PARAD|nr:hypothetical protein PanWU01x14_326170 [Parasponia andersonii]